MKKLKVVLFVLIMFFALSSVSYGENKINMVTLNIGGKNQKVREVSVLMDGQPIVSDIPSFIYNDRTLVPIRFVADGLGAKTEWNQENKTVTITLNGKKIVLKINSRDIYIDEKKGTLSGDNPPPMLVNDSRTMVPLRFVSENLGYKVGWDDQKSTVIIDSQSVKPQGSSITDISVNTENISSPVITIKGTSSMSYETTILQNPYRIVIDIPNSKLELKDKKDYTWENGVLNKISFSQFSTNPDVTRIVLQLSQESGFNVIKSGDGKSLEVSLLNNVTKVSMEKVNGKDGIVIYNTGTPKTNIIKLTNPTRIVVDLLNSHLADNKYSYDYQLGFIKDVRVSQFEPDSLYDKNSKIVRIVLDVKEGISDPNVKIENDGNKMIIYPEKQALDEISYTGTGNERSFSVEALKSTKYDVKYEENSKEMTISIPKDDIQLENGSISPKDGIVDSIQVTEDKEYKNIKISFQRDISYEVLSAATSKVISLKFKKNVSTNPNSKLIVIDPGHGGKDPGTVPKDVKEKDVALAISSKLDEKLTEKGYNTIMTRDTDVFVDLYERADIANRNNADLFISIHCNYNDNKDISGIQVLYCPASAPKGAGRNSYEFAKAMKEELIKDLGAVDKGVIERPNLVVTRETKMDAILIETGFLSNAEDEKLLTDEEYQYKMVDAIIKGIENFLSE